MSVVTASRQMPPNGLDHLVINVRFDVDEAQALFEGLGFTLTPRGHHSLGSVNHLMVFATGYLELIGLPRRTDRLRQEIVDSPVGIDGLVAATTNAEACHAAWTAQGLRVQPVQHFSRPLELDGHEHIARFSTARLEPGQLAAGRVYACQHHTPEYVWRPEWMQHANGVQGMAQLVVVSGQPAQAQEDFARLGHWGEGFGLEFTDAEGWSARFGALAAYAPERSDYFGAIRLRGGNLRHLAERARQLGLPLAEHAEPARLVVALPQLQTLLEFVP